MRAALLAVALSFPARGLALPADLAAQGAPPSLEAVSEDLAAAVGPPVEGRRAVRLAVEARAPSLAAPVETALSGALAARGWAVTPHRGDADPEAAARGASQDFLLRVRAGLLPGRRELALVGELIPTWASFFLQRHPGARAVPPRVVQSRTSADPATLLLAREPRPPGAPFASIRRIARLPERVLALSLGEPGEPGHPAVVAVTPRALHVLSPGGEPIASLETDPARLQPVRDPAATVAVADFGGGRIALRRAGAPTAVVLALRGGRLEPAGEIDAAPLCAGGAGQLFGAFLHGTGVLADLLSPLVDPGASPRSSRTLYGVAAAPGGGPIAYAALGTDLGLELLGPDLAPVLEAGRSPGTPERPLPTGTGFALADLDGDGAAELVASSPEPGSPDRIRIFAPRAEAPLLFASGPIDGALLAGAGGDLTGDGADDAVLAAVSITEDGAVATDLLLVTADSREAP